MTLAVEATVATAMAVVALAAAAEAVVVVAAAAALPRNNKESTAFRRLPSYTCTHKP